MVETTCLKVSLAKMRDKQKDLYYTILESNSSGFPCVNENTAILSTSYTIAQHHPSPGGGTTGRAVHDNTRLPSPPRQHGADIFLVSANIFAADGSWERHEMEGSVELVLYILTF